MVHPWGITPLQSGWAVREEVGSGRLEIRNGSVDARGGAGNLRTCPFHDGFHAVLRRCRECPFSMQAPWLAGNFWSHRCGPVTRKCLLRIPIPGT